jgi:hypothetical protein
MVLALVLAACAGTPAERPREGESTMTAGTEVPPTPTATACDDARAAIRKGRFVGWQGLPRECAPAALFGVDFDEGWGLRKLGSALEPARMRLLELGGYYRPLVSVRDGRVVMFDATNPELDGGWTALSADLGAPEAARDFVYSTVTMPGGERIHANRGVTVFLNPENQEVVHIAVYAPTTVADYEAHLRPSLDKHYR